MNSKTKSNTYADIYSYNSPYKITNTYYPPRNKKMNYDSQYINPYVLSGGEASGSVWTNPKVYDVAKDGGLAWIL